MLMAVHAHGAKFVSTIGLCKINQACGMMAHAKLGILGNQQIKLHKSAGLWDSGFHVASRQYFIAISLLSESLFPDD